MGTVNNVVVSQNEKKVKNAPLTKNQNQKNFVKSSIVKDREP